ncbi:hypothetical protein BH09VER1_BH09VER1_24260 [soil metagenome]
MAGTVAGNHPLIRMRAYMLHCSSYGASRLTRARDSGDHTDTGVSRAVRSGAVLAISPAL